MEVISVSEMDDFPQFPRRSREKHDKLKIISRVRMKWIVAGKFKDLFAAI